MEITAGKGQSQGLTQGVRRHIAVHVSWPSPANIYTHSSLRGGGAVIVSCMTCWGSQCEAKKSQEILDLLNLFANLFRNRKNVIC